MINEQILDNLREIIGNNKVDENVYNTFVVADKAIKNKDVVLEINPNIDEKTNQKMETSILGGLYFRKNESGIISFAFGKKYLDTYSKDRCIHYIMLIHEFKHLYDYLNTKSFFKANEKERFFHELEARKLEVNFIKYYLKDKFNLGRYENYILQSYEADNLESITITINRESVSVYQFLDDLELEYKENNMSKEQVINEIIKKADQLLEKQNCLMDIFDIYNTNIDDRYSRYGYFIRLKTFRKYVKYLLSSIVCDENEKRELLINYPKVINKFDIINYLINEHQEANYLYADSLDRYFEDDFEKNNNV
jgi:hypothetical protein